MQVSLTAHLQVVEQYFWCQSSRMIPAVVILGVVLWVFMSLIKYWYYNAKEIGYIHKLDQKILDEIHKPSKEVLEKV